MGTSMVRPEELMKKALLIPASFCFTPLVSHFQLMRGRAVA
jgi:hypothetical protein